jgi:hypothetical protein
MAQPRDRREKYVPEFALGVVVEERVNGHVRVLDDIHEELHGNSMRGASSCIDH